ncbi:MAG: Acetyltransferase family protein [Rickettsiales bacterium]|jgi:ribosomal protein S18 acetylase RimI-like enzyme|nr:Acetyltransferase family protein [Rickettsiales bacterium]
MTQIVVESITEFKGTDLEDICDATEATILDNEHSFSIGFNRDGLPTREQMEAYWKGILLVPDRQLIVGRLDGTIASSIQFVRPSAKHASSFAASVENHFVAPWARGHKLAKELLKVVEDKASSQGLLLLKLSVRAPQEAAVSLYEAMGYRRWGTLDKYEKINGIIHAGHFYCKDL